jgi:deoxyribonuclease-2
LSDEVKAVASHLTDVIGKKWLKKASRHVPITTVGNVVFESFAKNPSTDSDIYQSLIAPALATNLLVETWRKGAGHSLPSECDQVYHVNNVQRVRISLKQNLMITSQTPVDWEYTEDHAKWAVSDNQGKPFICIGDINRMRSQFKRGGGSLCLQSPNVWAILHESIEQLEACPKTQVKARSVANKISSAITAFFASIFILNFF